MTKRSLNVFQRLVRKWDQVHPYNAAQVMCLSHTGIVDRLDEAWARTLSALGLGKATLTSRSFIYSPPDVPPRVLRLSPAYLDPSPHAADADAGSYPAISSAESSGRSSVAVAPTVQPSQISTTSQSTAVDALLQQHITAELNRRSLPDELPFRPFAISLPDRTWLGLIYEHWTADSVSIRMLLHQWLTQLQLLPASGKPTHLCSDGYLKLFGPSAAGWRFAPGIGNVVRHFLQCRNARRVRTDGCRDHLMKFTIHRTPDGWINELRAAARKRQCTVNDLFLAALAQSCDAFLRFRSLKKRPDLALGSIVDLRPLCPRDLSSDFSLYLGFINTLCRQVDLNNFDALVRSISEQTQRHKQKHAAAAASLWIFLSLLLSRFMSRENGYQFARKHMPLAAGISNVNLAPTWIAQQHPHLITDFVRASPTGPVIPLAMTPTTLGNRFHVAMSIRSALIEPTAAQALANDFLSRLTAASGGKGV